MARAVGFFCFINLFTFSFSGIAAEIVNDVTQLNPIVVERVFVPKSVEEISSFVASHPGSISVGGGRFSMGGQTAIENSVQVDMRGLHRIVLLDVRNRKITVEAGIRWRDIQEVIDPVNLSIKIMQSYANFTVGGSLSVNVHGRYVGQGPLIRSVDSIKMVLADGSVVTASPQENAEIFYGAIGGYGGLGIIVEATLSLTENEKVARKQKILDARDYAQYFKNEVRDNPEVVFHNGNIYPPEFEKVSVINWSRTEAPLTTEERLTPRNQKHRLQPRAIALLNNLPGGKALRSSVVDPMIFGKQVVVWRNHEASHDLAELEPPSRKRSTFVLQEYFVPVARFDEFLPKMRRVFKKHSVKVFNVSIRHALPDPGSLLAWAPEEVFAFVVYYQQGTSKEAREKVGQWTRELVDEVLSVNGRYYLPYQLHPTVEQFKKAYVRSGEWFELKKKLDPKNRFRNKLWEHYGK